MAKRWQDTLAQMQARTPTQSNALSEAEAVATLADLFAFTDRAYGVQAKAGLAVATCEQDVGGKKCGLALTRDEQRRARCAFHKEASRFAALGLEADEVFKGSAVYQHDILPRLKK